MLQKIRVGIGTYATIGIGILTALPALANQIITYIENNQVQLSNGEKMQFITGFGLIAVGAVGRFAQAVAAILKKPQVTFATQRTAPAAAVGTGEAKLDLVREQLTEHPEILQQLKNEGVVT